MSRKKKVIETNHWQIRLVLTIILLAVFLLTFFLGGGLYFFQSDVALRNFSERPFEIHFIDVGQGDSIFLRFPDNTTMLVDCGSNDESNNLINYLSDLFRYEKIDRIDRLVLTHQDEDHVGKAAQVLYNFDVGAVYRPKMLSITEKASLENLSNYKDSTSQTYDRTINAVYAENCEMYYNERGIEWGSEDYSVEFLSPAEDRYSVNNNYSPIIMVTYNSKKFLLTGDAEEKAESEIVTTYGQNIKADVLKVGHHGSESSTKAEHFLEYVSPSYAIISAAEKNAYGLPKASTIAKLKAAGAEVLYTYDKGSIVMSVSDEGAILLCDKGGKLKIDVPVLIVCTGMSLIIIWGFKVPKKKNK